MEARELVSSLAFSNPIFDDDVDSDFVGANSKMREVFGIIHRLAKVDTTVLIRGENGTGKELVAKAIHSNSARKNGAFVAINCGAIPENLMESELFGHEKGAFTGAHERKIGKFQLANNGTLFLDEIAELRPELQVKLLRVLQEKKFIPVSAAIDAFICSKRSMSHSRSSSPMRSAITSWLACAYSHTRSSMSRSMRRLTRAEVLARTRSKVMRGSTILGTRRMLLNRVALRGRANVAQHCGSFHCVGSGRRAVRRLFYPYAFRTAQPKELP